MTHDSLTVGQNGGRGRPPAVLDIPRFEMSSSHRQLVVGAIPPDDRFVVGDMVGEAAMEDADEAVAEGP